MSGARAAAMEEAARTGEVPVAVPAEAVAAEAPGSAPAGAGAGGRHALAGAPASPPDGATTQPHGFTARHDDAPGAGTASAASEEAAATHPEVATGSAADSHPSTVAAVPVAAGRPGPGDHAAPRPAGGEPSPDAAVPTAAEAPGALPAVAASRFEDEADGWFAPATAVSSTEGPGVAGRATRADGRGLPTVMVTVADPAGHQEARTTTDAEGRYAVALRDAGTYLVVAAAGAYQPHAALVVVGPDAVTRHDVTLAGTSGVHGLVRHGGEPVAGAAVTLIDAHGDVAAVGVTDRVGGYRLAGVPDGAYTLTAASAGHQPSASSVWLDVGITVERNLELPQRARLVGTVTAESSGRPVEEATATLVDAGGVVVGTAVTDAEGAFDFADLPAGTYTLTARGYAPAVQTVHVEAGGTTAAEITLSPGSRATALP
jgi:hypothetical protein